QPPASAAGPPESPAHPPTPAPTRQRPPPPPAERRRGPAAFPLSSCRPSSPRHRLTAGRHTAGYPCPTETDEFTRPTRTRSCDTQMCQCEDRRHGSREGERELCANPGYLIGEQESAVAAIEHRS